MPEKYLLETHTCIRLKSPHLKKTKKKVQAIKQRQTNNF